MIIEYTLTKQDLFEFNFFVGWASPEKRNFRIKYYLKSFLSSLLTVFLILIIGNKKVTIDMILTFICLGLIIGFLGAHVGIYSNYKRKIERFLDDPSNSSFYTRTQLILSDSGIVNREESSETHYDWNAIIKKTETKDYIYLFLSSIQGIVIPKKTLNEKEKSELIEILSRNIPLIAEFNKEYFRLS